MPHHCLSCPDVRCPHLCDVCRLIAFENSAANFLRSDWGVRTDSDVVSSAGHHTVSGST